MATLLEKRSEALDTLDEWQELLTHFEISAHTFAYFPVLVPDEGWAGVCQHKLSDYLSAQDKKLHILAFGNPEDFKLLTVRIFAETFAPNTEAVWITTPIPFDSKQLELWKQAWREAMARLNQFRNKLTKNYPYTFLFVGGSWTHEITFNNAPDLWSIHSGIIRINPPIIKTSEANISGNEPLRIENKVDESIDVDFALRQAERLRGKKGAEAQFAALLFNASRLLLEKVEFRKALEITQEAIAIYEGLVNVQNHLELISILAGCYNNKGFALDSLGKPNEAIHEYEQAIAILAPLVEAGRGELANDLATAYMNNGVALDRLGKPSEANYEFDQAIAILAPLVAAGRGELANELAMAYMNKGAALDSLGKLNEAIHEHKKAIGILVPLVKAGRGELVNDLAMAYMNKGIALWSLGKLNEAIYEFDQAIAIREPLVEAGGGELANELAMAYMNKGIALWSLGKLNEAIHEYEQAIAILAPLVEAGRGELANELARAYLNKGNALYSLGNLNEAIENYNVAIRLWEATLERGEVQNLPTLALCLGNRLATHREMGNQELAEQDMQQLHELLEFTKQHQEIEHLGASIQAQIDKWS